MKLQKLKFLLQLCRHFEPHLSPPFKLHELQSGHDPENINWTQLLKVYLDYFSVALRASCLRPSTDLSRLDIEDFKEILQFACKESSDALIEIALSFEKLAVPSDKKNIHGVFYTPRETAAYMARSLDIQKDQTVLDPACGGGVFLLEVAPLLFEAHGASTAAQKLKTLEATLFGIDKNVEAVTITRLCLLLKALEADRAHKLTSSQLLLKNFRCGNSLLDREDDSSGILQGFSPYRAFGVRTFDRIIGNPPYGLSRNEQISPAENRILKHKFRHYLCGKPNKYLLFLVRACHWLSPGGELRFLIPNAWLGIRSGEKIRAFLLKERLLKNIDVLDYYLFQNAGVEVVIPWISKKKSSPTFSITRQSHCKKFTNTYDLKHEYPLTLHDSYIPVNWDSLLLPVIESLQTKSIPLHSIFTASIALQAYATGKGRPPQTKEMVTNHVYHSQGKESATYIQYLNGKDIQRYHVNWSGSYLSHGPWLADPQDLLKYQRPRVLLREILGDKPYLLQATYTEEQYLYNKSVLHIHAKDSADDQTRLLALSALLNSTTSSFLIHHLGKKSARKLFPKLVLDDLKHFLLPGSFDSLCSILGPIAREAHASTNPLLFQARIDKIVLEAYDLPGSASDFIRNFAKSAPRTTETPSAARLDRAAGA